MSKRRSPVELDLLKEEAETRVRRGIPYADIARDLGISITTLGNWAAEGRWRKKDIAFEQDEERGRALLAQLAEAKAFEQEETEERVAKAKQLGEAAMKAMRAADPKGNGAPTWMKATSPHQLSLSMAQALLEQGRLDEADRAARFALRFAQAQKAMNDYDGDRWREDRTRVMNWWKANREGFIAFHRHASEAIDELRARVRFEQRAQEADLCPTCSRPADFWPVDMDETREQAIERIEEMELAEDAEEKASQLSDNIDQPGAYFWRRPFDTAEAGDDGGGGDDDGGGRGGGEDGW